ncbi:hypothetical protein DASC09_004700 [Saccharomycopsis crataegensis]|uniref:SDE2-like domain-containing protein n=1 Tax=Saccharomycopsis crataegensis TaxID=43959 RepID=A0AAV5QDX7_9ASCO|nr:hypothetical protein DASC09_004700 [Saccharomycopsis crataegensis]
MVEVKLKCINGLPDIAGVIIKEETSGEQLYDMLVTSLPSTIQDTARIYFGKNDIRVYESLKQIDCHKLIRLNLRIPLRGGKGGFVQQLKAQGNKIAKDRSSNQEIRNNYRTLEGGRTVKEVEKSKRLSEYFAKQPETKKKESEEKRSKLKAIINTDPLKNVKFQDSKYLENSEELLEEIKGSMEIAMNESEEEEVDVDVEVEKIETKEDFRKEGNSPPTIMFAAFFEEEESDEGESEDTEHESKEEELLAVKEGKQKL